MKILILDDSKERHDIFNELYVDHDVKHVYRYHDCIDELVKSAWDIVHLDHDLGEEVKDADTTIDSWGHKRILTGMDVVNWILDCPPSMIPNYIIVHSTNPIGGSAMYQALKKAGINCARQPFLV